MRAVLIAAGALVMAFAVTGALTDPDFKGGALVFLVGVLVAHDAVLLPLTIGAGALIGRFVPLRSRPLVRSAALISLAVTVVALPLVLGPGTDYGRGLLEVYGVVWAGTGVVLVIRRVREGRRRRGDTRPRSPLPDPPPARSPGPPPTPGPAPRSPAPGTPPR